MKISTSKRWIRAGAFGLICLIMGVAVILVIRNRTLEIDVPGVRCLLPPAKLPAFSLIDQRGQTFTNGSLTGNWTLAVIGYTYCPDVCPTTLRDMAMLFKQFDRQPGTIKAPRFIFLSVDPFRDTPEELGTYVGYFHKDFLGITGTPENIQRLVAGLGLFYIYADPQGVFIRDVLHQPAMDDYAVVHYSGLLFINSRGDLVATMQPPLEANAVLAVLKRLQAYYGE